MTTQNNFLPSDDDIGFVPFSGTYEKKWYDIKLHDGWVVKHCWPNADTFHSDEYGIFAASLVKEVRLSERQAL